MVDSASLLGLGLVPGCAPPGAPLPRHRGPRSRDCQSRLLAGHWRCRSPWFHTTSIIGAWSGNRFPVHGRPGRVNRAIWVASISGSRPTSLPTFAVPYRYWPSFHEAIHPVPLCRSSSDWNSSCPTEPSSSFPFRHGMGVFCCLERSQKLVSVNSLLMRENPGANIPAHRGAETIPCSSSDCSAASRSARVSASVWTSPSR